MVNIICKNYIFILSHHAIVPLGFWGRLNLLLGLSLSGRGKRFFARENTCVKCNAINNAEFLVVTQCNPLGYMYMQSQIAIIVSLSFGRSERCA